MLVDLSEDQNAKKDFRIRLGSQPDSLAVSGSQAPPTPDNCGVTTRGHSMSDQPRRGLTDELEVYLLRSVY